MPYLRVMCVPYFLALCSYITISFKHGWSGGGVTGSSTLTGLSLAAGKNMVAVRRTAAGWG